LEKKVKENEPTIKIKEQKIKKLIDENENYVISISFIIIYLYIYLIIFIIII